MKHAPYFLRRCPRRWCLRKSAPLDIVGLCAEHHRWHRTSPEVRAAFEELLAKCKPVMVDVSRRPL